MYIRLLKKILQFINIWFINKTMKSCNYNNEIYQIYLNLNYFNYFNININNYF